MPDRVFARNRAAWEDWSRIDPLWAVVTDKSRRDRRWDEDEFFASGEATIADLWETASTLGLPVRTSRALDFGCGVGRLTRALGRRVDHVLGIDISEGMVERAGSFNAESENLEFAVHHDPDLRRFGDATFDVVSCLLVLQHIPAAERAERFLGELVRVLDHGGILMLQLMTRVPPAEVPHGFRTRLRIRTRLGGMLRRFGMPARHLQRWLRWQPEMALVAIADERARRIIAERGGKVVWSCGRIESGVEDCIYLVTRAEDLVSPSRSVE
jgi:SAM-dependent methyltransferase